MEWGQVFPLAPAALKTGWLTALFGGMLVLWVGLFFFITHMIQGAASARIAWTSARAAPRASSGAPTAWGCRGWPPAGTG